MEKEEEEGMEEGVVMGRGRLCLRGCCWKAALSGKADGRRNIVGSVCL